MRRIAWHYTTGKHAKGILATGRIQPLGGNLDPGESAVVWFTLSETFEPTANKLRCRDGFDCEQEYWKLIQAGRCDPFDLSYDRRELPEPFFLRTLDELAEEEEWLVRFGVDADSWPLKTFDEWSRDAGVRGRMVRALRDAGSREGSNPDRDWLASFRCVPQTAWHSIGFLTPEDVRMGRPWRG